MEEGQLAGFIIVSFKSSILPYACDGKSDTKFNLKIMEFSTRHDLNESFLCPAIFVYVVTKHTAEIFVCRRFGKLWYISEKIKQRFIMLYRKYILRT